MINRRFWLSTVLVCVTLLGVACGSSEDRTPDLPSPVSPPAISPTVIAAAPTQTPGAPTLTPSPTIPPTVTPMDSPPPPAATGTATPTETPGPYEHVIQAGDTCLGIAYEYGHLSPDVKRAIEKLNGMADCSILPGPGNTILIPRPTPTATPVGADLTQTAVATSMPPQVTLEVAPSFAIRTYVVQSGDTLSSIAILSDSSLQQVCELNPLPNGIDCGGCQWQSPNCCCPNPPVLSAGKELNVPAPTPTPTPTPTLTGSETPTSTPTHSAPQMIYPADGSTVTGPVRLTWLSVGVLAEDEYYLVTLRDETTGATFNADTRQLSLDIPAAYLPADGQAHTFAWGVSVARLGNDGLFYPLGSALPEQRFAWSGQP
jgi:LysM repeat protein